MDWASEIRLREPAALARSRRELTRTIGLHQFRQFLFFRQWTQVKNYAQDKGVGIIGDLFRSGQRTPGDAVEAVHKELDEYWLEHERMGPLLCRMGALREVVLPVGRRDGESPLPP